MTRLRLGISTCPNDTFAFHGLLTDRVDRRGLDFEVELLDVQELNERLAAGDFDVAKGSYHAALLLADELLVLPSGTALGYGVGPLLLAARPGSRPSDPAPDGAPPRVLCPGRWTTASLLYELFHPGEGRVEQVVFSEIMPALERGEADFGVCIHEGRFTWEGRGLGRVEDLGTRWEEATGRPLPLGGIFARRSLGHDLARRVQAVVRDSLEYGLAHRAETAATMRLHAQELEDEVLYAHVDLYVNEWTRDLGREGRSALDELARRALDAGLLQPGQALEVLEP